MIKNIETLSPAILYINLGPYHIARLRALSSVIPGMKGVEISSAQKLYPWQRNKNDTGFDCITLFSGRPYESISVLKLCKAVIQLLRDIHPRTVIISGYSESPMLAASIWCWFIGLSSILLFTSTLEDKPRARWKELLKRFLVSRYSAVAVTGRKSSEYVKNLGIPEEKIFPIGNVVDNEYFSKRVQIIRSSEQWRRDQLGLPDSYFLSVSRLSREKNYYGLLNAFKKYREQKGVWELVIIGDGPLRQELEQRSQADGMSGIHFLGWKDYQDLPFYYAFASCFILPSLSEPWGLVVNEAMASGLPVLVSSKCGCVPELCHDEVNGFLFDPMNLDELTNRMHQISSASVNLKAMGEASLRIISGYSPETWAAKLKTCIHRVEGSQNG